MPSFDIVSELDLMEIENSVNMVSREIEQRFDFRGSKCSFELDKLTKKVTVLADDDMKLRAIHQLFEQKLAKRGIDLRCLKYGKEEAASGKGIRQIIELKDGLDKEESKKVILSIKDSKMKVQAQVQDNQVRVTGKSIDDLQSVIAMLKGKELGFPLQFVNMRR